MNEASLPMIDLRRWSGQHECRDFLTELRQALHEPGAFYLIGHGVSPSLATDLFALARAFFRLPEEQKLAIDMIHSPHFRGYTRSGAELTRGQRDWREQLDIGLELEALTVQRGDPVWKRLQGPNQWPRALPALRPAALRWHRELRLLAERLLQAVAVALEQPPNAFAALCSGTPNLLLKIIRYPGRDQAGSDQGCGAHKDSGLVTLVCQDAVAGLELETRNGWLQAPPVPGSLFVNLGELLEIATDGYLRATVHRVVSPPPGTERLSLAFFLGARLDAAVPRLQLPAELAAQARGVEQDPANPLLSDIGLNSLKGRLRSHPEVARRFYADALHL